MRKMNVLLLFVLIVSVITGCSKDDKEEFTTSFIQIKMKYDKGDKGPEGIVYLFDITNDKVRDNSVYSIYSKGETIVYMRDVNDELVFPVYESSQFKPSKNQDGFYINESIHSLYWYELPFYFESVVSHKFLLVVDLKFGQHTSKVIEWGRRKNLELSKTFKEDYSDKFEEW